MSSAYRFFKRMKSHCGGLISITGTAYYFSDSSTVGLKDDIAVVVSVNTFEDRKKDVAIAKNGGEIKCQLILRDRLVNVTIENGNVLFINSEQETTDEQKIKDDHAAL